MDGKDKDSQEVTGNSGYMLWFPNSGGDRIIQHCGCMVGGGRLISVRTVCITRLMVQIVYGASLDSLGYSQAPVGIELATT